MTDAEHSAAKAALRLRMRALRKTLIVEHPEAHWQAGDHAQDMLSALARKEPGVIAVYRAAGSEIDPGPLVENMIRLGWTIALPACRVVDAPVTFQAYAPGDALAPDIANIAAPLPSAPELAPDVIVTPLLAFDRDGGRLGQGGGYYDRTLAAVRSGARPPVVVGLAFAGQEVDRVPLDPYDQKLDAILTERGYRPLA